MKKVLMKVLPLLCFVMFTAVTAQAAITLYDKEEMTFTTDAFFNTFYVYSSSDNEISGVDRDQSQQRQEFCNGERSRR